MALEKASSLRDDTTRSTRAHFNAIVRRVPKGLAFKAAIAHPCDANTISAALESAAAGFITPIFVGPREKIQRAAEAAGLDISAFDLLDTPHSDAAAEASVDLIRRGDTEILIKGSLHTDELLHAVLASGKGLQTKRRLSHVYLLDVPAYPKPLFVTDAAVNIAPSLAEKRDIVQNAIDLAHILGVEKPKVAVLSAVETVDAKLPSTLDAAALSKMADRGQITGGVIDGPLAFDNAISREAAAEKGIISDVAGDADILVVPDLEAGNILAKQLVYLAGADAAGIVLGARVPIVLTSRADTKRARFISCAIAVLIADSRRSARVPAIG